MNRAQHIVVSHPVNNDSLHSTPRSNPLATLYDAARRVPMRKLFKTRSDCTSNSSATGATTDDDKCVRFKTECMFRKTLSIHDYTPDEIRATWYATEDYQKIERQCQKEIRKINKGGELRDKKYCSRGLEGQTDAGFASKMRNRMSSWNAVLDEQLLQWDQGVFDEDTIAEIYIRASSSCQMWANFVGQQDQKAILGSLSSTSRRRSTASAAA
jgi:hypothetical protein